MRKDELEEKKRRSLYRAVFCNPEGALVMADILNDLEFFNMHVHGEAQEAMNNFAKMLLHKIGVWTEQNVFDITDAILKLPVKE